jgi:hypothetical protein
MVLTAFLVIAPLAFAALLALYGLLRRVLNRSASKRR